MRRMLIVMFLGLVIFGVGRAAIKKIFAGPFPEPVSKQVYAIDFRGCKAPQLLVERWLTSEPETQGKVVLVDFWATWCPSCRASIPELNELQARFKDDLVVIGISGERAEVVQAFREQMRMDYAVACDSQQRTARQLGIEGIPNVMIISTDGVVRWQGIPMSPEERLTPEVVRGIIEVDLGVAKRRAAGKQ